MAGYDAVIWVSTLDRYEGQLDEDDRAAIAEYLGGGGKLWVSSNRAIEALYAVDEGAFAAEWFGTGWIDIDSFYRAVQFVGEDILGGHDLTLEVMPGRPFVDKYELAADAPGTATAIGTLADSGTPGDGAILGIRYDHEVDGNAFRTVTTGFSLAQVSDPGDVIDVMAAVMEHLGVPTGAAAPRSTPIVYHSQLRQTVSGVDLPVRAIVLGGASDQPVTLFYRHHGVGDDYTAVPMASSGDDGGYRAIIPAVDVTPDGIDYYIRAGAASTYEPRAAATGALAHGVAVFMPEVAGPTPAPPAPPAPPAGGGGPAGRLPATGGTSLALLSGLALVAGLAARRVSRRGS
jgi:hypothetical protein